MFSRELMTAVKLEIRVPEVMKALEMFAKSRKLALDTMTKEVAAGVGNAVNQLLNAEIDVFLGQPGQEDNKRNGYHPEREYALKGIGCIRIRLPKDRRGRFESAVIPSYERSDPRLKADMAILHLAGLSTRTLAMISKRLLGVDVSKDGVSDSLALVKDEAVSWLTRKIRNEYWALYVDGTNFKLQRRDGVAKEPSLVVLGIDGNDRKSILAIEPGTRDNVEAWRSVFRGLKERGLSAKSVRVGIMDGLPGLETLFKEEFPNAVTARCWLHAMRNSLCKAPKRLRDAFKLAADKIMYATSEDDARQALSTLKSAMGNDCGRAIQCLEKDLESLLVHYRFDRRYWRVLKTTNSIERINKELKRRTKSMETIGESSLQAVVAFTALRLEMGWHGHRVDSKAGENLMVGRKTNVIEQAAEEMGLLN